MKTCSKCGETKPLEQFYRDRGKRDGRRGRCKECTCAQMREYYARPEVKARAAEYYAQNRSDILAHKAEYYTDNRAGLQQRSAEYLKANPHIRWESGYRLRAENYGHPVVIESFTKDELVARWGDACWHCGGPFEELDHYPLAVVHGGPHAIENCRPSCAPCNAKGRGIRRTNTNETENTK